MRRKPQVTLCLRSSDVSAAQTVMKITASLPPPSPPPQPLPPPPTIHHYHHHQNYQQQQPRTNVRISPLKSPEPRCQPALAPRTSGGLRPPDGARRQASPRDRVGCGFGRSSRSRSRWTETDIYQIIPQKFTNTILEMKYSGV